eukprot:CAMPEP_0202956798 /NCGR_PEP_ID=MMETSP1396-20130829/1291_1 /ASSEMBLY_ACC=CAM_ASM_000872 /TAXON_ID= /ORGANISM="Pseudokeronopsis sp., Strain Brazil" /LENGTH=217 /DNA_ID=CAMNT_0049673981 /DNA_START=21 /DNA_END=674 /DNA_ORIENTATION=-
MKWSLSLLLLLVLSIVIVQAQNHHAVTPDESDDDDDYDYDNPFGDDDSDYDDDEEHDISMILEDFNKIRGFMQGLEEGLYNYRTFELDGKCLGEDSAMEVEDLYLEITQGGVGLFTAIYDLYQLTYSINKFCYFNTVFHDLLAFCGTGECGFAFLSQNVLANFFKITAAANDLAQTFRDDKLSETSTDDEIFEKFEMIGKNMGMVIRSTLNFDQEKI